jgi:hypothetical protein
MILSTEFDPQCCPLPRTAARSSAGNSRCRPFLLPHPDAKLEHPLIAASERRQLPARFTTRASERKSGEEVLA